ncbi:MAG: hypothetical protein QOE86_2086, partial [Solirubrobacteraceae bacterium]|nr:hypothetical protein [Solirubrobacteraceae bacterium]
MIAAWLLFPLILGVLALGVGGLVERASGSELPVPLLFGLGFAGLVCITQLVTLPGSTAPAAPYVVVVVALAGLVLSFKRLRAARFDGWAAAAALATFVAFGAPAILTGEPTFLGYQNLGDASIHFELVDRWMAHGPSVAGLDPSSYRESVNGYLVTAYPTGAHTVLGVVRALSGIDVAWAFQPFLTTMAAFAALGLYVLAGSMTARRWLAAGMAAVAIQAALVYAYAVDEQGIKELATLLSIVTLVGLTGPLLRERPRPRVVLPAAVAAAGALGVISAASVPWIGALLLVALIAVVLRHRRGGLRPVAIEVVAFAFAGFVLALPALDRMTSFVSTAKSALTGAQEFGNLNGRPLEFVQTLGIWPAPDFRMAVPAGRAGAYVLIGAAGLAIVLGLIAAIRRRAWPLVLFAGLSVVAFVAVAGRASPWAYSKTLMLLSPALLLLATAAVAGWWEHRRRAEATVLALALVIGVGWTNAQAYHGIDAAPHARLAELASIGERYAGRGPSAYFEFEEFAKHFLRQTDPTGVVEPLRPPEPVADPRGNGPRFGYSSQPDDWDARSLNDHEKLLVVRQGPTVSRPPTGWRRDFHGRYYDVWVRDPSQPKVLEHLPLGGRLDAAGDVPCGDAQRLAQVARRAGGRLAWVPRRPVVAAELTRAPAPAHWGVDGGDPETWRPLGQGRVITTVRVPAGRFSVWLEASVGRAATVYVDNRR